MSKFCSNCGNELKENADVCLSCGQLINTINNGTSSNQDKLSYNLVVFGSLGLSFSFYWFNCGLITSLIGINDTKNQYRERSKIC